ncbi:hypothetical protein [Asticcacaulis tiandongensis]|uniref:hypothetical protein n=1 Tax=Asticcacaulis tiandongensis TaxID=2565365 RepID=UPI001C64471F|nr:hypothetical protein [Asticcacaulis tiandongensis]
MTPPEMRANAGVLAKPSKASRRKGKSRAIVMEVPDILKPQKKARKKKSLLFMGMRRVWRLFLMGTGSLLIVAGALIAPLPGPFGLPISLLGLVVVMRNSYWAKRQFIRLKKKHPNWLMPIRKLLRPKPKVASVFWQQALRTERLVFRRENRVLRVFRHRFLRPRK